MNWPSIILWGFVATLIMTTLEAMGRGLNLSRMSIPFLVGTMFTPNRDRATILGFAAHVLNGWAFAFLYGLIFESLHRSTAWVGGVIGLAHGLFVLAVLMPLMPSVHPRMADERQGPDPVRQLQPPGFLALHYGRQTAIVSLVAHAVYGAVLGFLYHPMHQA